MRGWFSLVKIGFVFSIGIFLFVVAAGSAFAADISYSVGQNTADHKTGSPTVSISGGVATFSVPQTGTTTGVGDRVTYNTSGVAYITGKISTSQWTLRSATGTVPADVTDATVDSVSHAFSSLASAIMSSTSTNYLNTTNLVTGGYALHFPCYFDSGPEIALPNEQAIQNFTTGANNYIRIYTPTSTTSEVNVSQRHAGKWDDTKYVLQVRGLRAIFIGGNGGTAGADYVRIDGLQISQPTIYAGSYVFDIYRIGAANDLRISNVIARGANSGSSSQYGIYSNDPDTNISAWNNIFFRMGTNGRGFSVSGSSNRGVANAYLYNNTFSGVRYGVYASTTGNVVVKNSIVQEAGTSGYYMNPTSGAAFSSSSTNNISNTNDAPGSNPINSATIPFVSTSTGDFHLVSTSTAAIDAGVDLSTDPDGYLSFTTDVDGVARSGTWDIGADEYVPPDLTPPSLSSISSSTQATTATITWTTNEAATSTVEYGTTTSYGSTTSSIVLETDHSILLSGLSSNTLYHFRVSSQDASGNVSTSTDYTMMTPDVTGPTITAFTIPSTSDSLTITISSFTATDDSSVTGYLVNESASTPSLDDDSWSSSPQTSYTFSSEGSKTLYAWAKDATGNVSTGSSASITVTLPTTSSNTTVQPPGGTAYISPYLPGYQYWDPVTQTMVYGSPDASGSSNSSDSSNPPLFVEPVSSSSLSPEEKAQAASSLQSRLSFLSSINLPKGSLVKLKDDGNPKTQEDTTVYYIGSDGKRHVFPNGKIYKTWFQDFSDVSVISLEHLSEIPLGSNILYKPGIRMVKFLSDPKCHDVTPNGVLRWVPSEAVARSLYGENWNTKIDDLSDAFYGNYVIEGR